MPYYGLTFTDVVNSFSQARESDFAVGEMSGSEIIIAEMAFQQQKLLTMLSDDVLRLLDRVSGEIATVSVSGAFEPALYADPDTIRGYIVGKGWSPCPGQALEGTGMCWEDLHTSFQTSLTSANIVSLGANKYSLSDVFNYKTQNLVLYYDVDQELLTLGSLKSLLRDMVCYSLGSRIYPVGSSDVWSIVTYYGEEVKKWSEYYMGGGMLAEYNKISLLNKRSGISSIRVVRG